MNEILVKSDMWVQHNGEHFIVITVNFLDKTYIVEEASNLSNGGILVQKLKGYAGTPDYECVDDIKFHFFKEKTDFEKFKNSIEI